MANKSIEQRENVVSAPLGRLADKGGEEHHDEVNGSCDAPASAEHDSVHKREEDELLILEEGHATVSQAGNTVVKVDSRTRSLMKGLTWRFLATMTTIVIARIVTGEVDSALRIGLFEFLTKLLIYYLHERIWTLISV